jgi:hypothetical protein
MAAKNPKREFLGNIPLPAPVPAATSPEQAEAGADYRPPSLEAAFRTPLRTDEKHHPSRSARRIQDQETRTAQAGRSNANRCADRFFKTVFHPSTRP